MRKVLLILVVLVNVVLVQAQEEDKITTKLYGWVRNDAHLDTYKGYNVVKEQYYLIPNYIGQDMEGNDLNKELSLNMTSIMTRFGAKLFGPEVYGAKTMGHIETDFLGLPSSNSYLIRIRHAYLKLDWEKSNLLIGQFWHPLFHRVYPTVVGINTGAPFQPFSRAPQLTYTTKLGSKFNLIGSTLFELQFTSRGPNGASDEYLRNAVLPELLLGLEYNAEKTLFGFMVDYKSLQPRLFTSVDSNSDGVIAASEKLKTDEVVPALNYMAYFQVSDGLFQLKLKGVYGNDLSHLVAPGGYAVSEYDPQTGAEKYTSYKYATTFLNILYGKQTKVGTFLGFAKNLGTVEGLYNFGTDDNVSVQRYGRFLNIDNMYRASAHISHQIKNLKLMAEVEYTVANYGADGFNLNDGLYTSVHETANKRLNIGVVYLF